MDLTPLDVRKKKDDLRRTVRGYDPGQVDAFLDLVADRLEAVVQEEVRLKEQVTLLRERLDGFEERERALNEALIAAQELREEARLQAEKQAGLRIQEADQQAERLVSEARRSAEDSERALADLHARRASYLRGMRSLLDRFLAEVTYEEARLQGSPEVAQEVEAPADDSGEDE
ncbi:MAG: DivIVA domain-containing protein [marine benthic group bacterium]|jgi:cell division initiation protein|nr:DivIVA domain-containing protein [Gemmatimonadota bacterium]